MRVLCHAYFEALRIECAVNRYNNTPKDFIVNFFLSIDSCCVLPFGFDASSCLWMDKLCVKILGKLIQFRRMKLDSVVL